MSTTTVLGLSPDRRPVELAEYRNGHGWAPSIWARLLEHHGWGAGYMFDNPNLDRLWQSIEDLEEWEQAPLVLTFDTGVIPFQEYEWAAGQLEEFERRLPAPVGHVNHVPAVAALLRSAPEVPLIGVHGTSVSENPFDPWDDQNDCEGSGIPLTAGSIYMLEQHRHHLSSLGAPS